MDNFFTFDKVYAGNCTRYRISFLGIRFSFKIRTKYSVEAKKEYVNFLEDSIKKERSEFVKIDEHNYAGTAPAKLIAFYLPQYHQIPLNDDAHGKGFTDWNNAASAMPVFKGHHQPHIPYDTGFYDLSSDKVMERQIELASMHGIHAFCFHYYWFSGKRLLEKPIFNYLNNKKLNFPFCFCWANENWSKLWDGGNRQVMMEQSLADGDADKFFDDILPFWRDDRYLKVDGKPILLIYRLNLFEKNKIDFFINRIRERAVEVGFNGVHCCGVITSSMSTFDYDVDAWVEFPPHKLNADVLDKKIYLNRHFKGLVLDMRKYIAKTELSNINSTFSRLYKSVFPGWDNTARKVLSGALIFICPPETYKKWLKKTIEWTIEHHVQDDRFVFINAWNEWGEGAHLEPDTYYGYAYLQATREALEEAKG